MKRDAAKHSVEQPESPALRALSELLARRALESLRRNDGQKENPQEQNQQVHETLSDERPTVR